MDKGFLDTFPFTSKTILKYSVLSYYIKGSTNFKNLKLWRKNLSIGEPDNKFSDIYTVNSTQRATKTHA